MGAAQPTEDQGFIKRGYEKRARLEDVLDAYVYVREGGYFLTVDGRMSLVWRLPNIPGDALSEDTQLGFAESIARVLDHYPEGSTGQYVRFTHRDIGDRLERFRSGIRQKGFFPVVGNSILDVQERGARFGFFAHPKDASAALDKIKDLQVHGDDGAAAMQPRQLDRQGVTRGTVALVTEQYLIMSFPSSLQEKTGVAKVWSELRSLLSVDHHSSVLGAVEREARQFADAVEELEHAMAAAGLPTARLDGNDLTRLLYRMLNPRRSMLAGAPTVSGYDTIEDALRYGEMRPTVRRGAVGTQIQTSPDGWLVDGYHHFVTSVRVMPEATRPAMLLEPLQATEGEGWCTINWVVPGQGWYRINLRAKNAMLNNQKSLAEIPILAPDPLKLQKREEDLIYVSNAINPEEITYHKVVRASVHMVVRDQDRLIALKRAKQLEKLLWNSGYRETLRGEAVIHHSLPLNMRASAQQFIRRDFPILTTNMADLLPLYTGFSGLDDGLLLFNNSSGEPVPMDLFTRHSTAGHALVAGGTGTGKSFVVNGVVSQIRVQRPTKTFVIDKGFNFGPHCEAAGGQSIVLVPEPQGDYKPICLNPLWIDDKAGFRQPTKRELGYMLSIVVAMLKAGTANEQGTTEPVTKEEMNCILSHLQSLFTERKQGRELMISDLFISLQKNPDDTLAQSLSRRLRDYTREGIWGALFDGPLEVNWDAEMIVIETSLMADTPALEVVMLALFSQIETYVKVRLPRDQRKIVAIDESWAVLAKPHLAKTVAGFFRELRKYTAAIVLISQSLKDFRSLVNAEGGSDDGILANTRHFLLLGASKSDMDDAEQMFGIGAEERLMWSKSKSAIPHFSEFFYLLRHKSNRNVPALLRYCADPITNWMSTTDGTDVEKRSQRTQERIARGEPPVEALQNAIIELAEEFPYGSHFVF